MREKLILVVAGALFAGLVAAGCGGDDDDEAAGTTAPSEPLSRQEFVIAADAICASGDREIERQAAQTFGNQEPSEEEIEQFATDTIIPNIQSQVDQLRMLVPPEGDEEEVTAILDAAQSGVDEVEQDPSLAAEGSDAGGAFTEANNLARDYGLKDCGG
jgi:hypothetical protein